MQEIVFIGATPAERLTLTMILFQVDPVTREPLLRLKHGLEGRSLRAFLRQLGLSAIRDTITRYRGVAARMANNNEQRSFSVTLESINFFRERLADLPRTAAQECIGGDLLDSLHGLHAPPAQDVPSWGGPGSEDWTPPAPAAPELQGVTITAAALQQAIDEFELELEQMPETVPRADFTAKFVAFCDRLTANLTEDS